MSDDERVRYTVQMPKRLREDAKDNSAHGELSEAVREIFRERAYGIGRDETPSKLDQKQAQLRDVREHIDDVRQQRKELQAELETYEARENRLEEEIRHLEREQNQLEQSIEMLTNMLHNGERMWPTRIKNAAEVDEETAVQIHDELKQENAELPERAFEEPGIHDPADWRDDT